MKNLLFCVLLFLVSFAVAQSSSIAQSGRIAFINPEFQLATVNPDGSDLRVLTEGAQRLQFPAWSPDSSNIASIGLDREGGFISIFADEAQTEGTEIYRSSTENPIYLYWSPDGKTVSFLANNPISGLALHLSSLEKDSEDKASSPFINGSPFYWQWQSDSAGMLIHTGFTGEGSRLGFTSSSDDTLTENLAPPGLFQAPGISASGNYIAYAEVNEARGAQLIVQHNPLADKAEVKREVPVEGVISLSWSPNGDQLAFTMPARNVLGELRVLEAETGLLETLSENLVIAFFWSPDGQHIAYLTPSLEQGEGEISSTGNPMLVSQKVQRGSLLLELRVIDIASKEDKRLATFTPTSLFVDQFLPFFDQYALSHRLWSPDSSAVVLPITNAENKKQITVFGLDGTVTAVGEGDTPFWSR
jgi:TolB protein